ncbi:hypothetical protein C8R43DRAFT_941053 [Mycena crocata]|nr:hypothetical protein C8R43DRAFT_941053 [Mycena crocata]
MAVPDLGSTYGALLVGAFSIFRGIGYLPFKHTYIMRAFPATPGGSKLLSPFCGKDPSHPTAPSLNDSGFFTGCGRSPTAAGSSPPVSPSLVWSHSDSASSLLSGYGIKGSASGKSVVLAMLAIGGEYDFRRGKNHPIHRRYGPGHEDVQVLNFSRMFSMQYFSLPVSFVPLTCYFCLGWMYTNSLPHRWRISVEGVVQ